MVTHSDTAMPPKTKSRKAFESLRGFLKLFDGGGGGNRTPVREHSTRSIYRFSSGIDFTTLLAPEQAQRSNLAGNLLAENPGELRSPPA